MGKRNKVREKRRRNADQAICAVLEAHSWRDAPRTVAAYGDFAPVYRNKIEPFRTLAVRQPGDWRCGIKSRSDDKRFLDLVRHTFARYPVPAHLENIWLEDFDDDFVDRPRRLDRTTRDRPRHVDLRSWSIVVAQGGSLYKQAASAYMTKAETHHFLNVPADVTSACAAFWYAFGRAQTDNCQVARNVSRTKLRDYSVASSYWKEVARYFVRNPAPIDEMDDLIDFLHAAKEEDEDFSLKGRSLPVLRRRMEDWHRALRKQQAICGGGWAGVPLPDVEYEAGSEKKRAIWRFRQIKTGNDLFREGQRMHHCVATYKSRCMSGEVSIWSLTCEFPIGHVNRGVTLEVRRGGTIVQCRGFANRQAQANEIAMVRRWANDHQLSSYAL